MPLSPGQAIAHYEVIELTGRGGMGAVYRARDTKLDREVAVKVLPETVASDSERLQRFRREAKLLASLNHPSIATLHGLEETDSGAPFIVMEFVPGETLAERVARGPMALEQALPLFVQIAEGLEAAHNHGVVHRDLKPANVKITPSNKVKILDFGLAKGLSNEPHRTERELSHSPTLTREATGSGVILGTPAYMSPEQARGAVVDKRADLWAFGCALFETLTGRQAFQGNTLADILASVMKLEPEWERLPGDTPAAVRKLLYRCLQKDPEQRLRDAGDARLELDDALAAPEAAADTTRQTPRWRRGLPWAMALAAAVGGWMAGLGGAPSTPAPLIHAAIPIGEPVRPTVLAISPDGQSLAYTTETQTAQGRKLYLRRLDELTSVAVEGADGVAAPPLFSPDGEWIGFELDNVLRKVRVGGGAPLTVGGNLTPRGAHWGPDETIIFDRGLLRGIWTVPASGGEPEQVAAVDGASGEGAYIAPQFLDSENVLFGIFWLGSGRVDAAVLNLRTGGKKVLIERANFPRYVRSGHLVFVRGSTLLAVAFDIDSLRVTGQPVPVLDDVYARGEMAAVAYSDSGTIAYLRGNGARTRNLVWVDRQGNVEPILDEPREYDLPRLSPDGTAIVVTVREPSGYNLFRIALPRRTFTRLTSHGAYGGIFSPNGERVAFQNEWIAADGSGNPEVLTADSYPQFPTAWSSDGRHVVATRMYAETESDIYHLRLDEDAQAEPLLKTPFGERNGRLSPDGRHIAYNSGESGGVKVFVSEFPEMTNKTLVTPDGGAEPCWSPSGDELFYRTGRKLMAVPIATEPRLSVGEPVTLFEGDFERNTGIGGTNYDVTPDGERFVMVTRSGEEPVFEEIHVVFNFFQELERLAPAR